MKILVINPGVLPNPAICGGAVETIIDQYSNIKDKNIRFTIYSAFKKEISDYKNNNQYIEYRYINLEKNKKIIKKSILSILNKIFAKKYFGNLYIREVVKDLKKSGSIENYDYVIIENIPKYAIYLNKFFEGKIILHQHNNYLNNANYINKRIIKSCSKIITVSDFVKQNILKIYHDAPVKTVYNGVNLKSFSKLDEKSINTLRKKIGIDKNDFVYGYVGRLVKEKGVKELLLAFKKIHKKYPDSKLLMIGSQGFANNFNTDFIDECKKIINEIKDSVFFTGYIDQKELNKYYSLLDVQIVPSIIDDACPMAVLEGMAIGLPQIVTDSGGIPEETCKENAIMVSRNNLTESLQENMKKLHENENVRKKMANASLERVKLFSEEKFVTEFINSIKF